MAERTLPGLGLTAFWPSGADGWGGAMDNNIRTLSAVAQLSVLSATTVLPDAANDGDIFIIPSGQDVNGVAVRDAGQWVIMSPTSGWSAWVVDTGKRIVFTGSSWVDEVAGGGGGEGGVYPYGGARIVPAADQNYTTLSAWDSIRFSTAERNTDGFWSASAPNVLTIPAGITKVRLSASLKVASGGIGLNRFEIRRVGGGVAGISEDSAPQNAYDNPCASITTDVLDVVEGEQFEVRYYVSKAFVLEANTKTWFSLEVVERTLANVGLNAKVSDLLDVDGAATPVVGDTLVWNGSEYVPGKPVVNVNAAQGMYKPFRGAMAKLNADKLIGIPPISAIQFDRADYDTNSFWSAGSPGRFTIPAGVKKVKLSASLGVQINTWGSSDFLLISFRKNGEEFVGSSPASIRVGYNNGGMSISSPAFNVEAGDFFEFRVSSNKSTQIGANAYTHFAIEVVEAEETLP